MNDRKVVNYNFIVKLFIKKIVKYHYILYNMLKYKSHT